MFWTTLKKCGQVGRGVTHTFELQMGLEKSLATCIVTHKFQLQVGQLTYNNRNLRARAARASPKIVIYKPALRATNLRSRGSYIP